MFPRRRCLCFHGLCSRCLRFHLCYYFLNHRCSHHHLVCCAVLLSSSACLSSSLPKSSSSSLSSLKTTYFSPSFLSRSSLTPLYRLCVLVFVAVVFVAVVLVSVVLVALFLYRRRPRCFSIIVLSLLSSSSCSSLSI